MPYKEYYEAHKGDMMKRQPKGEMKKGSKGSPSKVEPGDFESGTLKRSKKLPVEEVLVVNRPNRGK